MLLTTDIGKALGALALALMLLHGCDRNRESKEVHTRVSPEDHRSATGPDASAVPIDMSLGWCAGHGVPESVCTKCNATLIATFKGAGDWCAGHGLPESQCTICNPETRAEWAALAPKSDPPPSVVEDWHIERSSRLLTGSNDPLCPVDALRVRFIDPTAIHKAGIQVERAERRSMSAAVSLPAEVAFDATRLTRVTPRVAGVVRTVPVNVGDPVGAGDVLAVIDSPALGEAKNQFIERAENLKLAEADLRRINTIAHGVGRMMEVCTPAASAEGIRDALNDSPVGDAKSRLLRAHAALQLARAQAEREATLLEKSISSQRAYEVARSELAAAEADFIAIREEIAFDVQRAQLTGERAAQIAKTALESAERRLHILGSTEQQVKDIGDEPDESLSRFELRSPAAGRVIERDVAVGESVETRDELFLIAEMSTMWLMADAYERDLIQLRPGLPVLFAVDGMPGKSFEGKVSWISSQVDSRTRTVRVRADLPNPDGLLRANMFGQAQIILHDNEKVVTVSTEAVQTDGCCQLVFVRESETVFQPRKVALGATANGFAEVIRGLQEGEAVASVGSFLMKTEILKSNIGAGCCEVDPGR